MDGRTATIVIMGLIVVGMGLLPLLWPTPQKQDDWRDCD